MRCYAANHAGGSLRGQAIESPVHKDANFWNYDWGSTARPGSDVNHAEAVVNFAVEAHQLGVTQWSAAEMKRFVALNGSEFADGSGTGNGWFHGYAKLGRFDIDLHRRLEKHPPGNNSVWHCGNMAVSARILRGRLD